MLARKILLKFIHDLSNKLMQLEGRLALFRIDQQSVNDKSLVDIEQVAEDTTSMLRSFRDKVSGHTDDDPLMELTYISDANIPDENALEALNNIELAAMSYNELNQISGYLLYCNGQFIQRIEGRRQGLERLYVRIACDKRHRNLTLLSFSPIEEYAFKVWRQLSTLVIEDDDEFAGVVDQVRQTETLSLSASQSLTLINYISERLGQNP